MYKIDNQKDILYSTGNYTQFLGITFKGKESEKEYICIYEWDIYIYIYIYIHTHIYIPHIHIGSTGGASGK